MKTIIILLIIAIIIAVIVYLLIQIYLLRCRIEWIEKNPHPEFEYDKEDGCWVLKDCVRGENAMWYNVPPYYVYINIEKKKPKK